jgi:hypothetical protein
MTPEQKAIKNALKSQTDVIPDKVVCKANGTIEAHRTFFYRMGNSADGWAEKVAAALAAAGLHPQVHGHEEWNDWPKDSYFCAIIVP